MRDYCTNDDCITKECEKKEFIKMYIKKVFSEDCWLINCPDKVENKTNNQSREVDLIFETRLGNNIIVEEKSIQLYDIAFEKDVYSLLRNVSLHSSDNIKSNYDVFVKIKTGFSSYHKQIISFVEEFNKDQTKRNSYKNKKIEIEFNKRKDIKWGEINQISNESKNGLEFLKVILERDGQNFYFDFSSKNYKYNSEKLIFDQSKIEGELKRYINSKKEAFNKYTNPSDKKMLFVDIQFSELAIQHSLDNDKLREFVINTWKEKSDDISLEEYYEVIDDILFCLNFGDELVIIGYGVS